MWYIYVTNSSRFGSNKAVFLSPLKEILSYNNSIETTEVSVMAHLFAKSNRFLLTAGLSAILMISSIGCSGGTSPVETGLNMPNADDIPSRINDMQSGGFVLGVYDLNISSDLQSAEITPVRTLDDVGDSWFVEMTKFFIAKPCVDCLAVSGISLTSQEWVKVAIHTTHPFEKGDSSQPPDARNRDDVRVFDSKLIVIDKDGDGIEFPELGRTVSSTIVLNADGYTDMIEPVYDQIGNRPNDTHPYIILFKNPLEGNVDPLSPTGFSDLANASGHNVMNQGESSDDFLLLDLDPGESISLKLYLTANYGQSAIDYTYRLEPTYYIPEFNAKEAWRVEAYVESNSLGPGETESMAEIKVKVWDWQQGAVVDLTLSSLDKIRAQSGVAEVSVEFPGLFSGTVSKSVYDTGGTGQYLTPLEYRLEIYNELGAPSGIYDGLVCVLDERETGGNVSMPEDGIRNSGFGLVPFEVPGFRTYYYLNAVVTALQNVSPVARFTTSPPGDPIYIGRDEDIDYDATDSYDVDGSITTYEWDFQYDVETFNPQPGHTSSQGAWSYSIPGTYRIALRVTDNTIPIMNDITYKYVIVMNDPSNIEPRLIQPVGSDCGNLYYGAHNPIRIDGLNVYIPVGGNAEGERYVLVSDDYGSTYSNPILITQDLESPYSQHIGGFDFASTGELACLYFDNDVVNPQRTWMLLSRSPDSSTWYPGESLEENTNPHFIVDTDMIYGANDHMFIFFEMVDFSGPSGISTLNYFHRALPTQSFQDAPINIDTSGMTADLARFPCQSAAVDDDGNIHLAFTKALSASLPIYYYGTMYCRIAPDGSSITRDVVRINETPDDFSEKWVATAVDGDKVFVAYQHIDTMSPFVDLMLIVSHDNGDNWDAPVIVSDTQFPGSFIVHSVNIAVDQNHRIHFVWTDNRQAEVGDYNNIWYDYTDDYGQTFHQDLQLYGDGIIGNQEDPGIAVDDLGRIHVVWWNNDIDAGRGVWHTRFVN